MVDGILKTLMCSGSLVGLEDIDGILKIFVCSGGSYINTLLAL
jgi:hypothetical protein